MDVRIHAADSMTYPTAMQFSVISQASKELLICTIFGDYIMAFLFGYVGYKLFLTNLFIMICATETLQLLI